MNVAYFAVKSIGLSRVNGRKACTLTEAARHNLRQIQAELGSAGHIDPLRSRHNAVLAGAATAAGVQALAGDLMAAAGILPDKLRRDHCQSIEVLFSLQPDSGIDEATYFSSCLRWVAGAMRLPVLSAVIHHDESAPHLHVLLLPVRDGVHVGSASIGRAELSRLRENFFSKLSGPAGLRRDGGKMRGTVKQWAVAAVFRECEARGLPAANGLLWPVLVAAIERDPLPALQALGIDASTIRPTGNTPQTESVTSPIGFEPEQSSPVGFQKAGLTTRSLCSVGFGSQTDSLLAQSAPVQGQQSRLERARTAMDAGAARHVKEAPATACEAMLYSRVSADEFDLTDWGGGWQP